MSLLSRPLPAPPPPHEPLGHVLVERTASPPVAPPAPAAYRNEWDHSHLALAAWKARCLLAEAAEHLQEALVMTPCVDEGLLAELRAAIDATEATEARLRTAISTRPMTPPAEEPGLPPA